MLATLNLAAMDRPLIASAIEPMTFTKIVVWSLSQFAQARTIAADKDMTDAMDQTIVIVQRYFLRTNTL
jgi:hypothetical protein